MSGVAKTKATNTSHQWQTDSLADVAANAAVEGATISYPTLSATTKLTNHTQISTKAVQVSATNDAVTSAGRNNELAYQISKASKELKRDLLVFARNNPALFLELAADDNVQLRNFGIKATELGIIKLSSDQRTFSWGTNDRKLMTVPFDEHPYSALAAWFKTDEGMEIYTNIEKRLNA